MLENVFEGLNAPSKVYLPKVYFCKTYPSCVSSKSFAGLFCLGQQMGGSNTFIKLIRYCPPHLCTMCFITFMAIYQGKFCFGKLDINLGAPPSQSTPLVPSAHSALLPAQQLSLSPSECRPIKTKQGAFCIQGQGGCVLSNQQSVLNIDLRLTAQLFKVQHFGTLGKTSFERENILEKGGNLGKAERKRWFSENVFPRLFLLNFSGCTDTPVGYTRWAFPCPVTEQSTSAAEFLEIGPRNADTEAQEMSMGRYGNV